MPSILYNNSRIVAQFQSIDTGARLDLNPGSVICQPCGPGYVWPLLCASVLLPVNRAIVSPVFTAETLKGYLMYCNCSKKGDLLFLLKHRILNLCSYHVFLKRVCLLPKRYVASRESSFGDTLTLPISRDSLATWLSYLLHDFHKVLHNRLTTYVTLGDLHHTFLNLSPFHG